LHNGFIKQFFSLIGFIAGLFLAYKFNYLLIPLGRGIGIPHTISAIASFILIFLLVSVTAKILGKVLSSTAKILFLGWIDKILGAVFGLVEGMLFLCIAFILLSYTPLKKPLAKIEAKSKIVRVVKDITRPFIDNVTVPKKIVKRAGMV
jgi:membrane protein required for colicin V production